MEWVDQAPVAGAVSVQCGCAQCPVSALALALALALASRSFNADLMSCIKPSNFDNNIRLRILFSSIDFLYSPTRNLGSDF